MQGKAWDGTTIGLEKPRKTVKTTGGYGTLCPSEIRMIRYSMNITLDNKDGSTVLRFHEERLDAHNSKELKDYFLDLLDKGNKKLILDLAEVRFVDSSGLGALLSGHKNAVLREGRFALACVQSRVQSMFELTRLTRVFEIYPAVEDALKTGKGETPHDPQPD